MLHQSQVVQLLLEHVVRRLVQILPGQKGQLVGVLAHGRNPHRTGPVVVQVGLLEGVQLQLVRVQAGLVTQDVVRCGGDRALADALRHQEEVVPERVWFED